MESISYVQAFGYIGVSVVVVAALVLTIRFAPRAVTRATPDVMPEAVAA